MKNNRQLIFCLISALVLVLTGNATSESNPQYWVLYVVAGLLTFLSLSAYKESIIKVWRSEQQVNANQS
ncbi:hypothetical protein [Aliikangiella sp. G2MR2-5]|uniref:hypothetical protein n=1 Tax=Aliikangiella sp. G2MR2-5 TaxID=2788943 RepID=UPI0018AAFF09|nr:hypothetical protein [Aliikangiella sp. G2MR2-5]